jgi:FKBP-type peptidyl-prolyl cis-trans isomerase
MNQELDLLNMTPTTPPPSPVGDAADSFLTFLSGFTPQQLSSLYALVQSGAPATVASTEKLAPSSSSSSMHLPLPPRAGGAKKEKAPLPVLPEATLGAPTADSYRVPEDKIDTTVCLGRRIKGMEDKRWSPIIYAERQCGEPSATGSDLCSKCAGRSERYSADPSPKCDWIGRIDEEPPAWAHMLGTEWADKRNPRFLGVSSGSVGSNSSSSASISSSDSVSEGEMPSSNSASASSAPPPLSAAALKAAEKQKKEAVKLAEKQKKEEEKAAAAAVKEAEKKKKDEEKAAAKLKKDAEKAEKAAAKTKKPAAPAKVSASNSASAAAPAPTEVAGSLKLVGDSLYMVLPNGNAYEYSEEFEVVGDYVGAFTAEETIDPDAEEVGKAESETE